MADRFILILAGGRGERFWPWSTPQRPKQLLPLAAGGRTLLAATLERAMTLAPAERIVVLTARDLEAAVRRESPSGVQVIGEPVGRNTAPAIGAAAVWFAALSREASFAVMPSDHAIERTADFRADLERAFAFAEKESALITFGIPPTGPDTNFGYIKRGTRAGERLFRVAAFAEKPDRATAEGYLASVLYTWNAGIFVWRASVFLDQLRARRSDVAAPVERIVAAWDTADSVLDELWPTVPKVAVEYAVLEPASLEGLVSTVPGDFGWSDIGDFETIGALLGHDVAGVTAIGDAPVLNLDSDGVVAVPSEGRLLALLDVHDLIVVDTPDAVVVCRRDRAQDVKRLTELLRERGLADWG